MKAAELREHHKAILSAPPFDVQDAIAIALHAGDFAAKAAGRAAADLFANNYNLQALVQHAKRDRDLKPDVAFKVAGGSIAFEHVSKDIRFGFIAFCETFKALRIYAEREEAHYARVSMEIAQAEAREAKAKQSPFFKQFTALRDKLRDRRKAREQKAKRPKAKGGTKDGKR